MPTSTTRTGPVRIGVVAPASRIDPALADRVRAVASNLDSKHSVELRFHPQCFLSSGHFAGDDEARRAAFVETANDPELDAVWFARGGYGSCRLTEGLIGDLAETARAKTYLGYSDMGSLLATLYGAGFTDLAHGPMPSDIKREGGEAAVARSLAYLTERAGWTLEPGLDSAAPTLAFNITILSHLIGTPLQPDLSGHILLLEEIDEEMYRIDRALCHITSNPAIRKLAGIRLGRCSAVPDNDPPFEWTEEEVVADWCARAGIPYLGRADIGHDVDNKVVPFGTIA